MKQLQFDRPATDVRRDVLGWRAKFGVLAPSTNTIVEPEFHAMSVPGVTSHMGRIHIRDMDMNSDDGMERLLLQIRAELTASLDRVMTAIPDYIVMGMSAETFWGGIEGSEHFKQSIRDHTGLEVSTGADACHQGLRAVNARKIAVVTPYQEIADRNVVQFFTELGYDVVNIVGLRCPTAVSIAEVTEDELRNALLEVNTHDVDAIVQCGTNLSMVHLADEAERWLKKPVLAINAATWWHALRANGISDRVYGAGSLLRDF
jgi:maleate isomerase